jgi:hypothetical protein
MLYTLSLWPWNSASLWCVCGQQLFVPSHHQSLKSFESAQRQKLKGACLCVWKSSLYYQLHQQHLMNSLPAPIAPGSRFVCNMSSPVQVLSHLSLEQRGGWLAYLLSLLIENKHLYLPKTNMVIDQSPLRGNGRIDCCFLSLTEPRLVCVVYGSTVTVVFG